MQTWVVNDRQTCIEGSRTLWHLLTETLPGATFIGGDYLTLAQTVSEMPGVPDVLVRPASYFGPIAKDCQTIALVQEIHPNGPTRDMAVNVCRGSNLLVFNTEFTRWHYPELSDLPYRIIPIGVDAEIFIPTPLGTNPATGPIAWIGAPYYVKGWDIFLSIAAELSPTPFVVVTKAPIEKVPDNVAVFQLVPHKDLPDVLGLCSKVLCTSRMETQHLAGIEAGLCGLPIVSSRVGIYADLAPGPWGRCVPADAELDEWVAALDEPMECGDAVRQFWLDAGLDEKTCAERWLNAIEEVTVGA